MKPEIVQKFQTYPPQAKLKLHKTRALILEVAQELKLGTVEETLKWREPSYSVKGGSPVRIDWKSKAPNQIGIYFICTTKLVDTFREVYSDTFEFEGNRAIIIDLTAQIPISEFKHCISLAFQYKHLKDLPFLGV